MYQTDMTHIVHASSNSDVLLKHLPFLNQTIPEKPTSEESELIG